MDFYERAKKARNGKKRELGIEQDFLIMLSQRISQRIQDDLMRSIENNHFTFNTGMFGRKTDYRYETAIKICFTYDNVNRLSFFGVRKVDARGEGIVLYSFHSDDSRSSNDVYYITTCYLSDTKYILFYILKNLKKDFTDIFIEASWGDESCHGKSFVDGIRMTKSLIENIMDKIAMKDGGKVFGAIWFEITVEIPCDKKGNI